MRKLLIGVFVAAAIITFALSVFGIGGRLTAGILFIAVLVLMILFPPTDTKSGRPRTSI